MKKNINKGEENINIKHFYSSGISVYELKKNKDTGKYMLKIFFHKY